MTGTPPPRYVVEVNDVSVNSSGHGRDWWARYQCSPAGLARIEWVAMSIGGGIAHVACDDRAHAEWLRDHMVGTGGLHPKTVKVKKLKAATS